MDNTVTQDDDDGGEIMLLSINNLYNNQINVHALVGQSAMVYCASKLARKIVKIAHLLNYYIKAIDHKFL